ncbi:hypothetical protein ACFYTQ_36310 [Nocardia sp. NPDC004068]|uniref:hypothetical protein n=1 Tax=Nocardia sp. NPDC004068 TaxID=3364303 RepID=UPI003684D4C5
MVETHQLVVVGFDEIVANKYMPCITRAVKDGCLQSYSIVDLESERQAVEERLAGVEVQPQKCVFLPSRGRDVSSGQDEVRAALASAKVRGLPTMTYIATEVGSHEKYLRYCVEEGTASLVEKPVLAPLVAGRFEPTGISRAMAELIAAAQRRSTRHSVMTLSRYHRIYNDKLIAPLRERMLTWQAPVTSFHLRAAGGVWNLEHEYVIREDHPYRYGYGMLMHGAYHYIDLAVQILALNKLVLPDRPLRLQLCSFGAYPSDQRYRVPLQATARLGDHSPCPTFTREQGRYGETDVTSALRLIDIESGASITLGTLAFEQTTPSIRDWSILPNGIYNKNGRTSSVDVEAQLSTLYSVHVHCYDSPTGTDVDRFGAVADIVTRSNASLMPGEQFVTQEGFEGVFHSDSNRELMQNWLRGTETRSQLSEHYLPMRVLEALALSLRVPGQIVEIDEI